MPILRDRSPLPSPRRGSSRRSVSPRGVLLALATLLASQRLAAQGRAPLPLDPLTPQETRAAQRLAQADSRVRDLVGDRRHAVGPIDFLALKPDSAGPPETLPIRGALVHFYVYDGDYGVRALVDLSRRAVVRVERIERGPAPISPQEVATAKRMGLADPRVRQALGRQMDEFRVHWLGHRPDDGADPCSRHRCLLLVFSRGTRYLMRPRVVVDLTDQVVRVSEP